MWEDGRGDPTSYPIWMSYADCFAAGLAKDRKSELVTGDKEFKQVESEVSIRWF